jgi:NADPH:quinone reductase-like Zn-dependent oxidoreductase
MKAAVIDRYGPPEVFALRELPAPVPRDNEILVRIRASLATPSDCAFRSADPFIVRFFMGLTRPKFHIIGDAIAGDVEAVGKNVTRFKPGDRVYGSSDSDFGCYAEQKCLAENGSIVRIPEGTSYAEAVAATDGFLTSMPFLRDEAKLTAGQHILVNGASGSVGAAAVLLAKGMGARVTGVCSAANVALVHSLGADAVIDYGREDFTANAGAYDVIFDAVGKSSFSQSRRALTPPGVYMTTVPALGAVFHMLRTRGSTGQRAIFATTGLRPAVDKAADLLLLNRMLEEGTFRPTIDRTYPLAEIAEAHRYVDTGRKKGSVVVAI